MSSRLTLILLLLVGLAAPAVAQDVFDQSPYPNSQISNTQPTISARFRDGLRADQIHVDGTDFTAQASKNGANISWRPQYNLDYGQHRVVVIARGMFNEKIKAEWDFVISRGGGGGGGGSAAGFKTLAPRQGSTVNDRRPQVSATFSGQVRAGDSRIFVDGREFTSEANRSNTSIVWAPSYNLDAGTHRVQVLAVASNGSALQREWNFTIQGGGGGGSGGSQATLSPSAGSNVQSARPTISANFPNGIQANTGRIVVDGVDYTNQSSRSNVGIYWTPNFNLSQGNHSVQVNAQDTAGRPVTQVWQFRVGTGGGGGPVAPPTNPGMPVVVTYPKAGVPVDRTFTVEGRTSPGTRVVVLFSKGREGRQEATVEGYSDGTGYFAIPATVPKGNYRMSVHRGQVGAEIPMVVPIKVR